MREGTSAVRAFHRGVPDEGRTLCSRSYKCADCTENPGWERPWEEAERGQGVRGRCKHSLLPPKPACSLGERAPPSQPTWLPSCQGPGSHIPRSPTSPLPSHPILVLHLEPVARGGSQSSAAKRCCPAGSGSGLGASPGTALRPWPGNFLDRWKEAGNSEMAETRNKDEVTGTW